MGNMKEKMIDAAEWIGRSIPPLLNGEPGIAYTLGCQLGEIMEMLGAEDDREDIFDLMRLIQECYGPAYMRLKEPDYLQVIVRGTTIYIKREYRNEYCVSCDLRFADQVIREHYRDPDGVLAFIEDMLRKEAEENEPEAEAGDVPEEDADSCQDSGGGIVSDIWNDHINSIANTSF